MLNSWNPPLALDGSDQSWPIERLLSLVYVIGVILKGDGSVYKSTNRSGRSNQGQISYEIALRATSRALVDYFVGQCAVVLKRDLTKVQGPYKDGCLVGKYRSVLFYKWWKNLTLDQIKKIARKFPIQYLRGRFDSESNVANYAVYMIGAASHLEVLELDHELCIKLGMRTGPILPYGRIGEVHQINGRAFVSRVQRLRFSVNASDFLRVIESITVVGRNAKLHSMIKGRGWTPWSDSTRTKALAFGRLGLDPKKISMELEREHGLLVPPMTIYFWLRGTRSWAGYSGMRQPRSPNG